MTILHNAWLPTNGSLTISWRLSDSCLRDKIFSKIFPEIVTKIVPKIVYKKTYEIVYKIVHKLVHKIVLEIVTKSCLILFPINCLF